MMGFSNSQWNETATRRHSNAILGSATSALYLAKHDQASMERPINLASETAADFLPDTARNVISRIGRPMSILLTTLLTLIWSSGIFLAAVLIGLSKVL
jgi:hypothetical protein